MKKNIININLEQTPTFSGSKEEKHMMVLILTIEKKVLMLSTPSNMSVSFSNNMCFKVSMCHQPNILFCNFTCIQWVFFPRGKNTTTQVEFASRTQTSASIASHHSWYCMTSWNMDGSWWLLATKEKNAWEWWEKMSKEIYLAMVVHALRLCRDWCQVGILRSSNGGIKLAVLWLRKWHPWLLECHIGFQL